MKKVKLVAVVVLSLAMLLALVMALGVYAQEGDEDITAAEEDVGGAGLADPGPAGYSQVYWFTGVIHDGTGADLVATCVHCTNYGPQSTQVQVAMYRSSGTPYTGTATIISNRTTTFCSQPTLIMLPPEVDIGAGATAWQGSGQVLAITPTLICAAQVVDADSNVPAMIADLPLYRR